MAQVLKCLSGGNLVLSGRHLDERVDDGPIRTLATEPLADCLELHLVLGLETEEINERRFLGFEFLGSFFSNFFKSFLHFRAKSIGEGTLTTVESSHHFRAWQAWLYRLNLLIVMANDLL